jgi:hypothetical protein
LTSGNQSKPSIYLWHHASDSNFARILTAKLRSRGLVVFSSQKGEGSGHATFDPTERQMSKSDCILFLLSQESIYHPNLTSNVEKAMRRENVFVFPAYLENIKFQDLPPLLQFIQPINFFQDYAKAVRILVDEINRRGKGQPSKLLIPQQFWLRPVWKLSRHFKRYLTLPPLTFCWQITVENLIVSMSITGLIIFIFQPQARTNLANISASQFLWLVIILSPIIETLFFQMIPVELLRRNGVNFYGQIFFTMVPFAILHFTRSIGTGIGAGIIGGFYSSFAYVHWRQKSLWTAFWVTALSHGLYNLAIFSMVIGDY